ncbi:MAG: hypothetical protein IT427_11565 [Pirellulales bacterium]|nr:hypothetical protein [Pirellulales bacterium]
MHRYVNWKAAGWLICALSLAVGCGRGRPARVPVSGQVLIDGQPLKFGIVRFIPSGARASEGKLDETGHFTLSCFEDRDGAVVGLHQVEVSGVQHVNYRENRWHAPKKYKDSQTSGLTQEITGPTDSVSIQLTWDCKGPFSEFADVEAGSDGKKQGYK